MAELTPGQVYNVYGTRSRNVAFSYERVKFLGEREAIATDGTRLRFLTTAAVEVLIPPSFIDEVEELS